MKKTLLLLTIASSFASVSKAQSTLTAATTSPVNGDAFVTHTCDSTGIVPGVGGAGITWDFSGLNTTSTDTAVAVPCVATPHCSTFPGTSIASISFSTNVANYFVESSSALSQNGNYTPSSTVTFTDPMDQFHYPFTYLDSFADNFAGTFTYGVIAAHESGTVHVRCDGYGTLKLPGGLVYTNVLRVHSSQFFTDSAMVISSSILTFQFDTYAWYVPGYHNALMAILYQKQLTGGTLNNKIVVYDNHYPLAVEQLGQTASNMEVYPDPVVGTMTIKLSLTQNSPVHIGLYDMIGREVAVVANSEMQGAQEIQYNTTGLAKGIYVLRVNSADSVVARKVVLQ